MPGCSAVFLLGCVIRFLPLCQTSLIEGPSVQGDLLVAGLLLLVQSFTSNRLCAALALYDVASAIGNLALVSGHDSEQAFSVWLGVESLSVYYREAPNAVTGDQITEYRNKRFRYLQQAMKIYNARSDSTEPLKRCLEDYIEILYQPDAAQVECKKLVQQGNNIKGLQKDACQKMLECISSLLSENGPSPELMEDVSYYVRKRMEFGPPDKQSNLP